MIDDKLALLGKAKHFTSLDLKSGYLQVLMKETDKERRGLFEFNVKPFGLSNASAVFQELMSVVMQGLRDFAIAYLDDILVFSPMLEDHLKHLNVIFVDCGNKNNFGNCNIVGIDQIMMYPIKLLKCC